MSDDPQLELEAVGPEAAAELLTVVRAAFSGRPPLDPPTEALAETEESLARALGRHGGLVARLDGRPVGGLVLDPAEGTLFLRRVGVDPTAQSHGVAHRLVEAAVESALGWASLTVLAREELPRTIGFWESVGFTETDRRSPHVELRRDLPAQVEVPDAEAMRDLGERFGRTLRAGDVVILTGELGAGKTTFSQGLGAGLGVRGGITSPTFVISRVHPSLVGGPDLVHVDAYRLGGAPELDDLDLDAALDTAVTVVEWGAGLAEQLAERRIEVTITRALGDEVPAPDGPDPRQVTIRRVTAPG